MTFPPPTHTTNKHNVCVCTFTQVTGAFDLTLQSVLKSFHLSLHMPAVINTLDSSLVSHSKLTPPPTCPPPAPTARLPYVSITAYPEVTAAVVYTSSMFASTTHSVSRGHAQCKC